MESRRAGSYANASNSKTLELGAYSLIGAFWVFVLSPVLHL